MAKALEEDLRGLHHAFGKPVLMAEYGSSAVAGMHKVTKVPDSSIIIITINAFMVLNSCSLQSGTHFCRLDFYFILSTSAEAVVAYTDEYQVKKTKKKELKKSV